MSKFWNQHLLIDNTWSTGFIIPKRDKQTNSSTDWTLLSLNFTLKNYSIKLIFDQIDTACHFVFK